MNKRPLEISERAITYLSSLLDEASNSICLQNQVVVIYRPQRVITKHRMMEMVQAQIDVTGHKLQEILRMVKTLANRGLPFFWEERGPLLSQKDYKYFLLDCRSDHRKFGDMEQALSGKVVFDKLANDFELRFDFKATQPKVPMTSYLEAMELWE